mmetsp:Transcript_59482/g.153718  ORF Transcript_59482/g.153718 Transcript_59482/m.153718 type:complete len:313 (+) Transcript_59482:756-1694(+)
MVARHLSPGHHGRRERAPHRVDRHLAAGLRNLGIETPVTGAEADLPADRGRAPDNVHAARRRAPDNLVILHLHAPHLLGEGRLLIPAARGLDIEIDVGTGGEVTTAVLILEQVALTHFEADAPRDLLLDRLTFRLALGIRKPADDAAGYEQDRDEPPVSHARGGIVASFITSFTIVATGQHLGIADGNSSGPCMPGLRDRKAIQVDVAVADSGRGVDVAEGERRIQRHVWCLHNCGTEHAAIKDGTPSVMLDLLGLHHFGRIAAARAFRPARQGVQGAVGVLPEDPNASAILRNLRRASNARARAVCASASL